MVVTLILLGIFVLLLFVRDLPLSDFFFFFFFFSGIGFGADCCQYECTTLYETMEGGPGYWIGLSPIPLFVPPPK